jgi:signal transduction histidine kinase
LHLLKGEVLTGENAMEVLVQAFDGRELQVSIGGAPLRDPHGRIIGAVMAVRDMTERHRLERRLQGAEREARERANQLEAIFEAVTDAVLVYDGEGQIVQMNKAAHQLMERLLLSSYETFVTRPLKARVAQVAASDEQGHPLPIEQSPPSRILAGEVLTPDNTADIVLQGTNGQVVHLSVTGGPLRDADGKLTGAVTISHDVTERRRLEQIERQMHAETEARRALLQLILDELPSGVYLVRGQDARLVLANRATATLWGASWLYDQPMSAFLTEQGIRIIGVDGRPLAPERLAMLRAVRHGEAVHQQQEIIRHADGTTLPVLVNAVAIDAHGLNLSPLRIGTPLPEEAERVAIVVYQDVTALTEAEQLKDEFIGIAAHELRNPLAVLKGYAHMLLFQNKRGQGAELADWQMEALLSIDQSTLRLVELTEDLLDVTRLQSGGLKLYPEPTDLVALVRRVVKRLHMTTERHTLSIVTTLPYLVIQVDAGRIQQVLGNLLSNAIKYSPQGGPIELTIREDGETNMVLLSIRDQGIGIPLHEQARIFGRFARADNTHAHGIGGTGLGLYLCRELVERQEGRIWFESVEGQGSTFFIALPVHPDDASVL